MTIYTLYIEDDRYRVLTLLSVDLADDTRGAAFGAAAGSEELTAGNAAH